MPCFDTRSHATPLPPRLRGLAVVTCLFAAGIIGTIVLDHWGADLAWTRLFFSPEGSNGGWPYAREQPWAFLYDFGELPPLMLLAAALGLYGACKAGKAPELYRRPCLVIIFTIALGPGLLVNGLLKNYWGRPRPVEVSALGGSWEYRKVWEPGIPARGKSFTCGHCAMAFAVGSAAAFFPFFPVASRVALIVGVVYGVVMGLARMAQGGHFPTDVLWSGILVFMIAAALYYLVLRIPQSVGESARSAELPRSRVVVLMLAFVAFPAGVCLVNWPVYEEGRIPVSPPPGVGEVLFHVSPDRVDNRRIYAADVGGVQVHAVIRGFGAPWARIRHEVRSGVQGSDLHVEYLVRPKGYLRTWTATATLVMPIHPHPKPLPPGEGG